MRPSISPPPISTPWNSRCATCIVRSVENPSLRLASCESVEVVNGGAGRSTPGLASTDVTSHGRCCRSPSASPRAAASSSRRTLALASAPVPESKSLPVASRSLPTRTSVAVNTRPSPESLASRSQYRLDRNARLASSRSTISRTATLCTRPALSPVATFFHSTGDSV